MRETIADMTGEQWADDQRTDTTHFGGSCKVGDTEIKCYGDDRSDSHDSDVYEALVKELGIPEPLDELMEDQINDCVTDLCGSGRKWKITLDALELKWEAFPVMKSEEEIRERLRTWEHDFEDAKYLSLLDAKEEVVRVLKWVLGETE